MKDSLKKPQKMATTRLLLFLWPDGNWNPAINGNKKVILRVPHKSQILCAKMVAASHTYICLGSFYGGVGPWGKLNYNFILMHNFPKL
jgi:hypothetical protein